MKPDAKKRLLRENSKIIQLTFSLRSITISYWSCGQYIIVFRYKIRNDFAWNKSRFFKTRYFSCPRAKINMFIPNDLKQLKAYILDYAWNTLISFTCVNFILTFFDLFEFEVKEVGTISTRSAGGYFRASQSFKTASYTKSKRRQFIQYSLS